MPTTCPNPARELIAYLGKHANRCRQEGWLASLFHVRVTEDIAADVIANEGMAVNSAHLSEVEDIEAARCIEAVLADRRIPAADIPILREALRHVRVSAKADHDITEKLA